MQRYIPYMLLLSFMIFPDCYGIKIFSTDAKDSLIGRITGSFQRSLSNVVPDVNIQWDDSNRTKTLNAAEKSLHTTVNTCATQLRDLVSQLETATQGQLDHATHGLHNIAHELDSILEHKTDHAISKLEDLLPQIDAAMQDSVENLDTHITDQIEALHDRFVTIIDMTEKQLQATLYRAIDYGQASLEQSIKSGAYAGTGIAAATLGAYIITNTLLYPPLDPPEGISYTTSRYGSAAALVGVGFSLIGYSDTLAHNGFTGCAHNTTQRCIDTLRDVAGSFRH